MQESNAQRRRVDNVGAVASVLSSCFSHIILNLRCPIACAHPHAKEGAAAAAAAAAAAPAAAAEVL
jgi:hypothetical protein